MAGGDFAVFFLVCLTVFFLKAHTCLLYTSIRDESRDNPKIKELLESFADLKSVGTPWLDVDKAACTAKVTAVPKREDIDFEVDEQLIVELYSK